VQLVAVFAQATYTWRDRDERDPIRSGFEEPQRLMLRITSDLVEMTPDLRRWLQAEYRATFANHRKNLCSFTDRLEIRIPRILCESCFGARLNGIFAPYRGPDVLPESWESDLANLLDE
jgi:hypothetical protein